MKYIKQGKLIGVKLGRVYRIKESDVNEFLQERMTGQRQSRSEPKASGGSSNRVEERASNGIDEKAIKNESTQPNSSQPNHFNLETEETEESEESDEGEKYYVI